MGGGQWKVNLVLLARPLSLYSLSLLCGGCEMAAKRGGHRTDNDNKRQLQAETAETKSKTTKVPQSVQAEGKCRESCPTAEEKPIHRLQAPLGLATLLYRLQYIQYILIYIERESGGEREIGKEREPVVLAWLGLTWLVSSRLVSASPSYSPLSPSWRWRDGRQSGGGGDAGGALPGQRPCFTRAQETPAGKLLFLRLARIGNATAKSSPVEEKAPTTRKEERRKEKKQTRHFTVHSL